MGKTPDIGISWCTFFNRPGLLTPITVPTLKYAYRAPSLFASKMTDAGHVVRCLGCDEELRVSDVDGTHRSMHDEVEFLYFASHGRFEPAGYEAFLEIANWVPAATGLGKSKLKVVVFDTCELIDGTKNWQALWATVNLGPTVRLLLGFDGSAALDQGHARRGSAFAEHLLNGKTFAYSWIRAVRSTSRSQFSRAVAIGIGDSPSDASSILNSANLTSTLPVRSAKKAFFESIY